jgi:hypothetical protein
MDEWKKDFINGYNLEAPIYEGENQAADPKKWVGQPTHDLQEQGNRSRIKSAKE